MGQVSYEFISNTLVWICLWKTFLKGGWGGGGGGVKESIHLEKIINVMDKTRWPRFVGL